MKNVRRAGDIILDVVKQQYGEDFLEKSRKTSELFSSWEKIVYEAFRFRSGEEEREPAAAIHSRIRELDKGTLTVEVDHSTWMQLLQTKQAQLLAAANRQFPKQEIRSLVFRLRR
jgi:hypothetical protein